MVLTLLVFGNAKNILNADASLVKGMIQGIQADAKTLWDCILGLVINNVPNGAEIFVEGSKSYAFLYNVAAGLLRGVFLIVSVFVMLIVILLVNAIYRLISRIVTSSKNKKKKKNASQHETYLEGTLYSRKNLVRQFYR